MTDDDWRYTTPAATHEKLKTVEERVAALEEKFRNLHDAMEGFVAVLKHLVPPLQQIGAALVRTLRDDER